MGAPETDPPEITESPTEFPTESPTDVVYKIIGVENVEMITESPNYNITGADGSGIIVKPPSTESSDISVPTTPISDSPTQLPTLEDSPDIEIEASEDTTEILIGPPNGEADVEIETSEGSPDIVIEASGDSFDVIIEAPDGSEILIGP